MRKGFTLIELIFVIVIIGVLAAVAIPKYQNLKQSAEVNNVVKVVTDAMSSVPGSYVNKVDLEGTTASAVKLSDLLEIKGKGWTYASNKYTFADGSPATSANTVATLTFDSTNRNLKYNIDCSKFSDTKSQNKCKSVLGITTGSTAENNVTF